MDNWTKEQRAQYERDIRHAAAIFIPNFTVVIIILAVYGWPF